MSKLKTIEDSLKSNPEVVVVRRDEDNLLPGTVYTGAWSHLVRFYIYPKSGLYTAHELQEFMEGLVPSLKSSTINCFSEGRERVPEYFLSLGSVWYDEKIGEEMVHTNRVITITDEYLFNTDGFNDRKKIIDTEKTINLQRRICLHVYPNEDIALDITSKIPKIYQEILSSELLKSELSVSRETIAKYRPELA